MGIMTIIYWIIVGFIVGVLAKWIMPGKDPGGFWITVLIGVAGAFVGGLISSFLGIGGGLVVNLLFAVGGGVLLLFVYRKIKEA